VIEGRKPEDQLAVGSAETRVADLAGEKAPVCIEGTAVRLRDRCRRGRRELAHLGSVRVEDAPSGGSFGLATVFAQDEATASVGQEADHAVHVAASRRRVPDQDLPGTVRRTKLQRLEAIAFCGEEHLLRHRRRRRQRQHGQNEVRAPEPHDSGSAKATRLSPVRERICE
jgi:hypothetical protein